MYKCNNNKKGQEFERQKRMMYERVWREEREGMIQFYYNFKNRKKK